MFQFYLNLYTSSYSSDDSEYFFKKVKNDIPTVQNSFKEHCDSDLTIQELDLALKTMKTGKSSGQDGLTSEFYKFFWEDLKMFLFEALQDCIRYNNLLPTMKQGLIILIPKPGKDKIILENLRPITLLNTDYKIFSGVIAARLRVGLPQIISETQSGFLKGRSIHNNIRLVLDILEYSNLIENDGFILFLDFLKTFDMVEHPFLFQTLSHFGFGPKFINIIKMLYSDINSSVALPKGTCPRFQVNRGIRQGCGSSPLLFIMVAEMLAILVKNENIAGINFMDHQFIISQLADDTTLFLKDHTQIPLAFHYVECFAKASGLQLNTSKCELMAIHELPLTSLYNVPIKKEVKYLGITISKDVQKIEMLNIDKN